MDRLAHLTRADTIPDFCCEGNCPEFYNQMPLRGRTQGKNNRIGTKLFLLPD